MIQPFRNSSDGLIRRDRPLNFTFDGRTFEGFEGDTLASALLANGVRLVGRSFKYHRPRGIFSAGPEEPNALVQLEKGERTQPNLRATQITLYDGLVAESQNRWPSLHFDLGAVNGLLAPLFPAGFYYKTFMWPAKLWPMYERFIRKVAGLGRAPTMDDPDTYAQRYVHCDVLVIGGGPSGLMAAKAAANAGARVIIVNDDDTWGGALLGRRDKIHNGAALDWIYSSVAELDSMPDVTLLTRASASAYFDHNLLVVTERVADHLREPPAHLPRQRVWKVRAKEVVFATGAIERPLVFADNDRPGVMLASAAQTYANRYGVRAGTRAVIFTNNDSAYTAAEDLAAAGVNIVALVDARSMASTIASERVKAAGINPLAAHVVVGAHGARALSGVTVEAIDEDGRSIAGSRSEIRCDLVCVSGGWTPTVHLHSQAMGKLRYDETLTAFVPDMARQRHRSAGASNGRFSLADCLRDGAKAGAEAARAAGFDEAKAPMVPTCSQDTPVAPQPVWIVPGRRHDHRKSFVDFQDDVTAEDVILAHHEGFESVEHLKRYTTLGMGTDQGRTSNINGLAIMAELRGISIADAGTTTFRPPYTPVTLGAVAGPEVGEQLAPTRRSPMHSWHECAGAPFVTAGLWLRPQAYPHTSEKLAQASQREARHVRHACGMVDVSPLGKIDIQGTDAATFIGRVYVNNLNSLRVGKIRYGLMLREDGIALDDGTITRIDINHYLVTTTTVHAGTVMDHLEYHAQVVWPELDVHLLSVTDDWAAMAIAGPNSRRVLETLTDDIDLSSGALPFMAYQEGVIAGVEARLFRISFSGELAFELNVPADLGLTVWKRILEAGRDFDIIPYGTEAMGILRVEKGFLAGAEFNGRTTADDLGFGQMVNRTKDFIGRRGSERSGLIDPGRKKLVGLIPVDGSMYIPPGAQLVTDPTAPPPVDMQGEVTSECYSPNLDHSIALGLLANGGRRHGETLFAYSPITGEAVAVTVTHPVFLDPEGRRARD